MLRITGFFILIGLWVSCTGRGSAKHSIEKKESGIAKRKYFLDNFNLISDSGLYRNGVAQGLHRFVDSSTINYASFVDGHVYGPCISYSKNKVLKYIYHNDTVLFCIYKDTVEFYVDGKSAFYKVEVTNGFQTFFYHYSDRYKKQAQSEYRVYYYCNRAIDKNSFRLSYDNKNIELGPYFRTNYIVLPINRDLLLKHKIKLVSKKEIVFINVPSPNK